MNKEQVGSQQAIDRFRTHTYLRVPDPSDGTRILVDRLWPRRVTKGRAMVHVWVKEIAPSPALNAWFGHAPARWLEFRKQYADELTANEAGVRQLASLAAAGPVTLLYAARDDAHSHALVLADYVRNVPRRHPPRRNSHSA